MGSQTVRHDLAINTFTFFFSTFTVIHWPIYSGCFRRVAPGKVLFSFFAAFIEIIKIKNNYYVSSVV